MAVLLALAAIGLYYYLSHYQTELPSPQAKTAPPKSGGTKPKSAGSKTEPTGSKTPKTSENKRQDGGKSEGRTGPDTKGKKTSAKSPAQSKESSKATKTGETLEKGSKGKGSKVKESNGKGSKGKTKTKDSSTKTQEDAKKKYSTREGNSVREELKLSEIRVLRRPIGPVDPDRPYVIEILMGDNLLQGQKWSLALEKFNEILKMFPQSPRALYGKGVALENLALEKKSNKLTDTAIDFYSDAGLKSFISPADVKVAALLRLSEVAQGRGKLPLAVTALEEIQVVAAKNDVYALPSYANRLGLAHLSSGQTDKAMAVFQGVFKDHPDNSFAKAHIGFILFTERKYEEALPMLLEGIRKDRGIQTNAKFYLYTGECLTRLNRTEEVGLWSHDCRQLLIN